MRNKTSCFYLIIFFLGSLVHCRAFLPFSKSTSNYHSSDFECNAEPGWRDADHYQRYRKIWQELRSKYHEENASTKRADVVIIGNSLVHLFTPELMKREFPNTNIVNRGIGGDMTETLLERIQEDALVLRPKTLIIEIGGNDLIQGKCLSLIENNYRKLVEVIRKNLPGTKVIFISIPPTDVPNLNAIVPLMNSFIYKLTKSHSNMEFIDTWPYMRSDDIPTIRRDLLREGGRDRLHFNEAGYSIWGRLLRPHL